MKRMLCWTLIVLSNVLIFALCAKLMDTDNKLMLLLYVIAPFVFSLPWWVIMKPQK